MAHDKASKRGLDIKVYEPTHKKDEGLPPLNPMLPKYFSCTVAVAPTAVGKTNMLLNMLLRKEFYGGKFDKIVIMCPTFDVDEMWQEFNKKMSDGDLPKSYRNREVEVEVFSEYSDALLHQVVQQQKKDFQNPDYEPNLLLILDDVIAALPRADSMLGKYSAEIRHYKTTVVLSIQKFTKVPALLRLQATYWMLFRPAMDQAKEFRDIYDEIGAAMSKDDFRDLWESCGNKPYNFLVYATRAPADQKYRNGFKHYIKFEESDTEA
jgi:hypothetical protein